MSKQIRSGAAPIGIAWFRSPPPQPTLHSLAAVFACGVGYFVVGWFGGHAPMAGYWLPSSLLLAALLLHRPQWWWLVLLPAIAAHYLSMRESDGISDRMCSLICSEGLASCVALVLHGARSGRWFDGTTRLTLSQTVLCLLLPPAVVLMLAVDGAWSTLFPTLSTRLECCLGTGLLASLVGFVTVTPAIVTLCGNDAASMTPRDLARICGVVLLTAVTCIGARFYEGAIGQLPLCALPLLALWSGYCFGFIGLALCLLTAALLLPPVDGLQLFLFATAIGSLIHTRARLDGLATLKQVLTSARARIHRSIERQNLAFRATHDAIVWWNVRRDRLRWSYNARIYFGPPERATAGWQVWDGCIEGGDRARVLDELQRLFKGAGNLWRSEFEIRRRDGVLVPVRCRGMLVRDVRGNPWRMVVALRDITDARRVEASAHALARSARLATIGEITATITHEVNQPLAAILNNAETALLLLKNGNGRSEMMREILEDIRDDDLRASQIVRRTRALLQNKELIRERIDINDAVIHAVNLLSEQARRRLIRLTMSLAPLPPVHADALHIEQVVINIVNNALDAAASGLSERRQVDVVTSCNRAGVEVRVRDSGRGIPAAELQQIFESFHTTKAEGLGLGLSLARTIVMAHGGRIFAENNQRESGATICVELPAMATYWPSMAVSSSD